VKDDAQSALAAGAVLIVDDEPDFRFLLRTTLELAGYAVIEASHGAAALDAAATSFSGDDRRRSAGGECDPGRGPFGVG